MAEHDFIAAAAAQIAQLIRQHTGNTCRFRFTPATGSVEELQENNQPPFATVTGGEIELNALLRSFEDWEGVLKIGVLEDQGLLDFWLY